MCNLKTKYQFSRSVMSYSLQPLGLWHSRLPCPSPTPRAYSNACPSSQWCYPNISSSVIPSPPVLNLSEHQGLFNESALHIRWPKYWSFRFSISPFNQYSELISFRIDWFDLLTVQGTLKSLCQNHSSKASIVWCWAFFIVNSHIHTWPLEKPLPWPDGPLLAKSCLCFWICYLGWS